MDNLRSDSGKQLGYKAVDNLRADSAKQLAYKVDNLRSDSGKQRIILMDQESHDL